MQYIFGAILLVSALFLIVAVLLQQGKTHNLSGAIGGGAETFFGKTKGKTLDKKLSKLTTIVAVIFALLVITVYVVQPDLSGNIRLKGGLKWGLSPKYVAETTAAETTSSEDTTAADTTTADTTAPSDTTADTTDAGVPS